jgi:hypothetical protein
MRVRLFWHINTHGVPDPHVHQRLADQEVVTLIAVTARRDQSQSRGPPQIFQEPDLCGDVATIKMDYQVLRLARQFALLLHSVHKTRTLCSKPRLGFKYFEGHGWIDGTWVRDLE